MSDVALVLGWGSPIGIGILLVCIAATIWILARVNPRKRD